MNISDETVEAFRRTLRGNYGAWRPTFEGAKTLLEAAAPHLMAAAWDECAASQSRPRPQGNPYRTAGPGNDA